MLRNRLMTGLALLVLLGAIAGCGGDIGQSPEEANTLERTVEETIVVLEQSPEEANLDLERTVEESIVVLEQPAEEANIDLEQPAEETNTFIIRGWVTVDAYRYDAATGTYVHFYHDESSNLVTDIGMEWVEDMLGDPLASDTDPARYISLSEEAYPGDATAATWTILGGTLAPSEITTFGLARASGEYETTATTGEWTISNTFLVSGGSFSTVQLTGLQWVSTSESDGDLFAVNSFASVALADGDSLTITWTLSVAGP